MRTRDSAEPTESRMKRGGLQRVWLFVLLGIGILLVAAVAWIGVRGYLAKGELEAAIPQATRMQAEVVAGHGGAAAEAGERLQIHAARAASLTGDPIWAAAEKVPWLGPNLQVMGELAASVDAVAQGAVEPLSSLAATISLTDFKPADGRVDLKPLVDAQPDLAAADATLTAAITDLRSIEGFEVIGPLADARRQYRTQLRDAASAVDALDRAVRIVPAMLGFDGPRDYLLLFQNNAELRASGGNPGALALVHTDAGAFSITRQASTADFPYYESPVIELPFDTRGVWGDNTAQYMQDVTFTPQFPLTGEIAAEMWKRQFGSTVDGVIATDPVMLSYLLRATGPVTLASGGVLASDDAVQLLLSDVYARYPDLEQQDAFFADAAASVFSAVASGSADPRKLIDAFVQGGDERRVRVWNVRDDDQKVLAGTTLAGVLPGTASKEDVFGLYLNDLTAAKMDTYLDVKVQAGSQVCRNDRRPNYEVWATLTNTAPADAATSLPGYVTGAGKYGVEAGKIATAVALYGPPGSYNLGAFTDGVDSGYQPTIENGHPLSKVEVILAPGESTTVQFGFLGDDPKKAGISVEATPRQYPTPILPLSLSCANALF